MERWTSDQLNTFSTYLSSLLGGFVIAPSKPTQKWRQKSWKSVQLVRGSSFWNDLLQNPYFRSTFLLKLFFDILNIWITLYSKILIDFWKTVIHCLLHSQNTRISFHPKNLLVHPLRNSITKMTLASSKLYSAAKIVSKSKGNRSTNGAV